MTMIQRKGNQFGILTDSGFQADARYTPDNDGINPKELLEASLGLCTAIVLRKMMERDGVALQDDDLFSVAVHAEKPAGGGNFFEQCTVEVELPDHFSSEYKQKLIQSAERACTIGNTLKRSVKIITSEKGI